MNATPTRTSAFQAMRRPMNPSTLAAGRRSATARYGVTATPTTGR
jgi:hypothetical protein